MSTSEKSYWFCILGPVSSDKLPSSVADSCPRIAASTIIEKITGEEIKNVWSGWGLDEETVSVLLYHWRLRSVPKNAKRVRKLKT